MNPAAARLSIIIPTLNEADAIGCCLEALAPIAARGHEIIVVDGGSRDDTVLLAGRHGARVSTSGAGRALQMNAGAGAARGDVFVFLHADTRLPPDADRLVLNTVGGGAARWGRFDVRLSGEHWMFPIIAGAMNVRSCLTGVATGDQGIFIGRELFEAVGGFPAIPLMEDVAISRRLKRHGRPACLRPPAVTSSRRWESGGVLRTVLLMWRLRAAYALGVSPGRLVRMYDHQ